MCLSIIGPDTQAHHNYLLPSKTHLLLLVYFYSVAPVLHLLSLPTPHPLCLNADTRATHPQPSSLLRTERKLLFFFCSPTRNTNYNFPRLTLGYEFYTYTTTPSIPRGCGLEWEGLQIWRSLWSSPLSAMLPKWLSCITIYLVKHIFFPLSFIRNATVMLAAWDG